MSKSKKLTTSAGAPIADNQNCADRRARAARC